jgi:hypothetical protein
VQFITLETQRGDTPMTDTIKAEKSKNSSVCGDCRCGQHPSTNLIQETVMTRIEYLRAYFNELAEQDDYASLYTGETLVNLVVDDPNQFDDSEGDDVPEEAVDEPVIKWLDETPLPPFNCARRNHASREHRWRHVPGGRAALPKFGGAF